MSTVKSQVQTFLARAGLYQRVKASVVYDLYWRVADRKQFDEGMRELNFFRGLLKGLRRGDLIFDVGANEGVKTGVFLKLGAKVLAIEPDPANQRTLRERFHRLRMVPRPVTIVGAAVSDKAGVATMWANESGSYWNTLSPKWVDALRHDEVRFGRRLEFAEQRAVETTTLDELIVKHGRPFYIKIDVEGAEPEVLRGLRQPVPFVSFEVNLPEFRPEGLECIELLRRLSPDGRFNYVADWQQGFALNEWLSSPDFARELSTCNAKAIDVFWRASS